MRHSELFRAPHLTFVQVLFHISRALSPILTPADLSQLGLACWVGRDTICRLREGCQVKGGVKKSSHPEGSPGHMRSTSLGLCVRREQGEEECFLVCMPAGQRVEPGIFFAPCSPPYPHPPSLRAVKAALITRRFYFSQNQSCC